MNYKRKYKQNKIKKNTKKKVGNGSDLFLKYFVEHAKSEKGFDKYKQGLVFLKKFKFSLCKAEKNSFLISLTRNYSKNPISLSLSTNINGKQIHIYSANLRFLEGKVIIETLQGTPWLKEIREFEKAVNLPASRHLVREITTQSKKMGFDKVLLINPTAHPSYSEPYLFSLFDEKTKEIHKKIVFREATKEEKDYYKIKKQELIQIHKKRMEKLYNNVANGEGFIKRGNYFIKKLK